MSFTTVVMNIENKAISEYRNADFTNLAYFNGKYYGSNDDGIYELTGDTDATNSDAVIIGEIKTGIVDTAAEGAKSKIREGWITFRTSGPSLVFNLEEDESADFISCEIIAPDGSQIKEGRIKFPRGLKGRFYAFEIKGEETGQSFELNSLRIMDEQIPERVR